MSDVITGARCAIFKDGKKIAYATNVSVSRTVQQEPVDVLDDLESAEHVPTGMVHHCNMGTVRLLNKSAAAQGLFFTADELKGGNPVLNLRVKDTVSGKVLMNLMSACAEQNEMTVNARGISMENVSFVCRTSKDESQASKLVTP